MAHRLRTMSLDHLVSLGAIIWICYNMQIHLDEVCFHLNVSHHRTQTFYTILHIAWAILVQDLVMNLISNKNMNSCTYCYNFRLWASSQNKRVVVLASFRTIWTSFAAKSSLGLIFMECLPCVKHYSQTSSTFSAKHMWYYLFLRQQ